MSRAATRLHDRRWRQSQERIAQRRRDADAAFARQCAEAERARAIIGPNFAATAWPSPAFIILRRA
jgi:hypothetical protein